MGTRTRIRKRRLKKRSEAGLPDFSWHNIPKREQIYQITTKYLDQMIIKCTKRPYNRPNGINYTNIYHWKTLQYLPKFNFLFIWVWQPCSEAQKPSDRHFFPGFFRHIFLRRWKMEKILFFAFNHSDNPIEGSDHEMKICTPLKTGLSNFRSLVHSSMM
jgi:hypothetical protein